VTIHHDNDEHPEHAAAAQAPPGNRVQPPPAPGDDATNMHTEGQQDPTNMHTEQTPAPKPLNMHTESATPQND